MPALNLDDQAWRAAVQLVLLAQEMDAEKLGYSIRVFRQSLPPGHPAVKIMEAARTQARHEHGPGISGLQMNELHEQAIRLGLLPAGQL